MGIEVRCLEGRLWVKFICEECREPILNNHEGAVKFPLEEGAAVFVHQGKCDLKHEVRTQPAEWCGYDLDTFILRLTTGVPVDRYPGPGCVKREAALKQVDVTAIEL
jgi:hypothetical protein